VFLAVCAGRATDSAAQGGADSATVGPTTVRLLLGGDLMLGRLVNETIASEGSEYPMEALAPLTRAADLFFVNLECAISPQDARFSGAPKKFYFRADPLAAKVLQHTGVDLVSLANNHALDADYGGLIDTIDILEAMGIAHAGAGADIEEASQPAIVRTNGQTIGVLSYGDHQGDFLATKKRPGIRYVDLADPQTHDELAEEVAALSARVDHVVVAFHWQPNWVPSVKEPYRRLARQLANAGARVIWGHSPHHFQGVEWIGRTVVIYSSGDFLNDYATDEEFRNDRQLLFEVVLTKEADEGGVVSSLRALPIELEFTRTRPATGEVSDWIEARFIDMCAQVGSRVERRNNWLFVPPDSTAAP
jgi:poly-gamma-glutamate synthesis protein (capsule biosynthesis protein)